MKTAKQITEALSKVEDNLYQIAEDLQELIQSGKASETAIDTHALIKSAWRDIGNARSRDITKRIGGAGVSPAGGADDETESKGDKMKAVAEKTNKADDQKRYKVSYDHRTYWGATSEEAEAKAQAVMDADAEKIAKVQAMQAKAPKRKARSSRFPSDWSDKLNQMTAVREHIRDGAFL